MRRYSPVIWSTCRRYAVTGADAEDVAATVWLRLVANVATIREPKALPGWLATTTRRECLLLLRNQNRLVQIDDQIVDQLAPELDAPLLVEERRNALRGAFARMPDPDRRLLSMLFADPPMPYADISNQLDMPIGAIGPTRQRCLARVRRHPAVAALLAHR